MKKYIAFFGSIIIVLIASCGMSPDFNLNYAPPADDAKPADIFPEQISGNEALVSNKDYGGTEVKYGDNKVIYVARLSSGDEAIAFFKENLLSEFQNLSTNFSGNINGQYYAKAKGNGKKFFGWVNGKYVFVLKGYSEDAFEELLDNFDYISRN